MSLLKQVLDIVALPNEKNANRQTPIWQRESSAQRGRSLQHVWVAEINLAAIKAGESISEEVNAAMIYELGKSNGEQWELIDQQRCEVRGDAEEFCRGFRSTMTRLGMKQGDSIIMLASEQHWIDCAMREMSATTTGGTLSHEPCPTAGVVLPPPSGSDHFVSIEQGEVEQVIAAIRRVKIIEYLKKHLLT